MGEGSKAHRRSAEEKLPSSSHGVAKSASSAVVPVAERGRRSRPRESAGQAAPGNADFPIDEVMRRLRAKAAHWNAPVVTLMAEQNQGPFRVLIGCLLSLRTKDETTAGAVKRLFALGKTPQELLEVPTRKVEQAIYPVGFYRTKAKRIQEICRILVDRHGGRVPNCLEALLELPGVGRKTANLVLVKGFDLPGICVDTHVHRITNRWGYVRTHTPQQTEFVLRSFLPRRHWKTINDLLVAFGQTICKPVSPICSRCPVAEFCARRGVYRHR